MKKLEVELELNLEQLLTVCNCSQLIELKYVEPSMIMKYYIDNDYSSFQIFKSIYDYAYDSQSKKRNANRLFRTIIGNDKIKKTNFRGLYDMAKLLFDLDGYECHNLLSVYKDCSFIKDDDIREYVREKIIRHNGLDLYQETLLSLQLLFNIDELIPRETKYFPSYITKPIIYNIIELMKKPYLNEVEIKYMNANINYFIQALSNTNLLNNHHTLHEIQINRHKIISYIDDNPNLPIDNYVKKSLDNFKGPWEIID